jgi:hypothetical protein
MKRFGSSGRHYHIEANVIAVLAGFQNPFLPVESLEVVVGNKPVVLKKFEAL